MKKCVKISLSLILSILLVFSTVVCAFAASDKLPSSVVSKSKRIAEQIEDEGIVLLKNEGNLLPLSNKKVNVFGIASCSLILGGGGSGSVDGANAINFYKGLDNAGIEYNTELFDVYSQWKSEKSIPTTGVSLIDMLLGYVTSDSVGELPSDRLTSAVISNAQSYSDNAVVVISRTGAELADLTAEDFVLSDEERTLLDTVTANFTNVVLIYNTSNILDLSFLDSYPSIKAVMLMYLPGDVGANSVGSVLSGKVNPSGKLVDTVAYNLDDNPTTANFGSFSYSGIQGALKYFVNYSEGIYVGYRYFETFAPEKVQFPFGYGLSYTTFDWDTTDYSHNDDKISVTVKVTNTGSVAGKDTVQLYFSAPYTDGGIEKSAIELAGYAKTDIIDPGDSDSVTITFNVDDMASYDYKTNQAWVLESGDYQIKVAHTVRDFEDIFTYNIPQTKIIKNDDATGTEIRNLFDDENGGLTYFSRSDPTTYPTAPTNFDTPNEVANCDTRPEPTTVGTAPKTGVTYDSGDIMLADVAADNSLWDKFLDQLTLDEMIVMIAESGYKTAGIDRLGIPATVDNDGPAMVKGDGGLLYKDSGTAFPVETVVACTWNDALAEEYGKCIGDEANSIGTNIWYAPACNIHRNPLAGRNFEYFSEDPLLSGKMTAAVTRGVQSKNVIVTVKHFAANDQETNRMNNGLFTWSNEQALREIYFEPFEIAVKEGNAKGIMAAYNRLGATWCSASSPLLIDLLRNEWGFDGFVVTDAYVNFTGSGYMDPVLAIYARNDALLTSLWYIAEKLQITQSIKSAYEKDPIGLGIRLRECARDLCVVKMQTLAFDASATTGHKGESSGGGNQPGTIPGNPNANISNTGALSAKVSSVACLSALAAAAVIAPFAYRKRKRHE